MSSVEGGLQALWEDPETLPFISDMIGLRGRLVEGSDTVASCLVVECYEGYRAQQEPVRFWLGRQCLEIQSILDRWYGVEDRYFKVKASDGHLYILRCSRQLSWTLESFRRLSIH